MPNESSTPSESEVVANARAYIEKAASEQKEMAERAKVRKAWQTTIGKAILEGSDPGQTRNAVDKAKQKITDLQYPGGYTETKAESEEEFARQKNTQNLGAWALNWTEKKGSLAEYAAELERQKADTRLANELEQPQLKPHIAEITPEGGAGGLATAEGLDPQSDPILQFVVNHLDRMTDPESGQIREAYSAAFERTRRLIEEGHPFANANDFLDKLSDWQDRVSLKERQEAVAAQQEYQARLPVTSQEARIKMRAECFVYKDPEKTELDRVQTYIKVENWLRERLHRVRIATGSTTGFGPNDNDMAELRGVNELVRDSVSEPLWLWLNHTFALLDLGASIKGGGGEFKGVLGSTVSVGAEAYQVLLGHKQGRLYGRERDDEGHKPGDKDYLPEQKERIGENSDVGDAIRALALFHEFLVNTHRENLSSFSKALGWFLDRKAEKRPEDEINHPDPKERKRLQKEFDKKLFKEICLTEWARTDTDTKFYEFPKRFIEATMAMDIYFSWNEQLKIGHVLRGAREGKETIGTVFYGVERELKFSESRMAAPVSRDYDPWYNDGEGGGGEFKVFQGLEFFAPFMERFLPYLCKTIALRDGEEVYQFDKGACRLTEEYNESLVGSGLLIPVDLRENIYDPKTGKIIGVKTTQPKERVWNEKDKYIEGPKNMQQQDRKWEGGTKRQMLYKFTKNGVDTWLSRRDVTYNKATEKWSEIGTGTEIEPKMVDALGYIVNPDLSEVRFEDIMWIGDERETSTVSGIAAKYWAMIAQLDIVRGMLTMGGQGGDPKMATFIEYVKKQGAPHEKVEPEYLRQLFCCKMAIPNILYRLSRNSWTDEIRAYGFDDPKKPERYLRSAYGSFAQRDNPKNRGGYLIIDAKTPAGEKLLAQELQTLWGEPFWVRPESKAFRDLCRFFGTTVEAVKNAA